MLTCSQVGQETEGEEGEPDDGGEKKKRKPEQREEEEEEEEVEVECQGTHADNLAASSLA